jgi:hypothetical protein
MRERPRTARRKKNGERPKKRKDMSGRATEKGPGRRRIAQRVPARKLTQRVVAITARGAV